MTNQFGLYLHRWRNLRRYEVLLIESFWLSNRRSRSCLDSSGVDHSPLWPIMSPCLVCFRRKNLVLRGMRRWYSLRYKPGKFICWCLITCAGDCCWHSQNCHPRGRKLILRGSSQWHGKKRNWYTETLSRMKHVFWNTKHYNIRSGISKCQCSFAKDGRRRGQKGIYNPVDLGRYPLHVVSVVLYSWLSKVYLTLLDLYSDKIWTFQINGKWARVVLRPFKCSVILWDSPLKS